MHWPLIGTRYAPIACSLTTTADLKASHDSVLLILESVELGSDCDKSEACLDRRLMNPEECTSSTTIADELTGLFSTHLQSQGAASRTRAPDRSSRPMIIFYFYFLKRTEFLVRSEGFGDLGIFSHKWLRGISG